jgi:hypothetical protein
MNKADSNLKEHQLSLKLYAENSAASNTSDETEMSK